MSDLPPLTEQTAAPGTKLNGYDRTITRDNVETFVSLTSESVDSYLVEGELTVSAGMLMGLYGPLSHGTFHYEAGVHVSSELELGRVPRVDEPIRVVPVSISDPPRKVDLGELIWGSWEGAHSVRGGVGLGAQAAWSGMGGGTTGTLRELQDRRYVNVAASRR
jgi:hypothetical protein